MARCHPVLLSLTTISVVAAPVCCLSLCVYVVFMYRSRVKMLRIRIKIFREAFSSAEGKFHSIFLEYLDERFSICWKRTLRRL